LQLAMNAGTTVAACPLAAPQNPRPAASPAAMRTRVNRCRTRLFDERKCRIVAPQLSV
jgi:hypothetical protein